MSLDTVDKLVKGIANNTTVNFFKQSIINRTAADMVSLWYGIGYDKLGELPTTTAYCNKNTVGALPIPTILETEKLYIAKFSEVSSVIGNLMLFDRLSHMGGLNGTLTTLQSVNLDIVGPSSQGRCKTDGTDVQWYLEWYIATGTTARNITITYTNQDNVSGRIVTYALPATRRESFCFPIFPNLQDTGIKSIESIQLNGTTGIVGNFGVTARKYILGCPNMVLGTGCILDYASTGLFELKGMECLELLYFCGSTATGNILGNITFIKS
jgi:hypothetical protein